MKLTKEKIDLLTEGTRDDRKYACARSFQLFAVYYFTRYFTYKLAPYHYDFFDDVQDLVEGRVKDSAWIAFRESAKTSLAKMALSWIVARQEVIDALREKGQNVDHWGERRYLNVDCYDKNNAESILFDVVTELQTNPLLIADFGHLYNQPRTKDEASLKRISNFVTNNGIRVEAHTALTPMRGRIFKQYRPDFVLRDDLENAITAESPAITEKIVRLLDEAKGGMAGHGASLTIGNFIIENGVMGYIKRSVEGSDGRVRFIPVVDRAGTPAWPEKYVATDLQALDANQGITDPSRRKISLESKKRELNSGGRRVYEVEMLLDPVAAGSPFFDRAVIDRLIAQCTPPLEDKAGFLVWQPFKPGHRYCNGADTGKGNGGDHSTSALIDFSTIPAQQVGSYANNEIPADLFGHELKRQGDLFGTCLLAPEKNSESGGSTLTTLKMIYPVDQIYRQVPADKLKDIELSRQNPELGWETTGANKYTILFEFKNDLETGGLIINDERILRECRSFTFTDADDLGSARIGHFTNHFDLLMAAAIANHVGKRYATVKATTNETTQGEYETPSL